MGDFDGMHAVVTGAAAGIGRATARLLAARGARVTAFDRDAGGLGTLEDGIAARVVDLTDAAATEAAWTDAQARGGPPGILVNVAGADTRHPLEATDDATWARMLALNLDHPFRLARRAAPGMAARGGGAIVTLTSTAWMKMAPDLVAYHTAKAGLVGMTRGLARDLGAQRIRVNAVAPGRVATERAAPLLADPDWMAETRRIQCLPDVTTPEDVARTVAFLASNEARMITGQVVVIDGGVA
ncbi:MAG: SDR family NAD(P)-dependent oxidoreductase [Paracoccaceae bacterium]